jgi:putative heme-binding domain-containing protein
MRQLGWLAMAVVLLMPAAAAQSKSAGNAAAAQIERGRQLFEKSPKGTACATCHKVGALGTAVGPDLKDFAGAVGARAIAQSIEMSMTAYVQQVKTASGTFPGLVQQKSGDETDIWDLSTTPPELKKLPSKDIVSMESNTTWKHPPSTTDYTSQELADVIAFLKNAATGARKEIKAADVEDSQ